MRPILPDAATISAASGTLTCGGARMGPVVIETTRLNLRGWTSEDVPGIVKLFDHPEVSRYINDGKPITPDQAMAFVEKSQRLQRERGWCRWAIEPQDSPGQIAGFCGIGCTFAPLAELGWTLRRDRWGAGLATEAARAVLTYAFGVVGFAEMVSAVDPANERSRAVAERVGMVVSGEFHHDGSALLKYSIDNPLPSRPCNPRYRCDCEGEQPGSSLTVLGTGEDPAG